MTPEEAARAAFPGRPLDVPIDRIDPCDLLGSEQAAKLSVKRVEGSGVIDVNGSKSRICTWLGATEPGRGSRVPLVIINVQFIAIATEVAAGAPGAVVGQVNGYGSVTQAPDQSTGDDPICMVSIDAAPQRSIRVQALSRPVGPRIPDDDLCRRATDAASMVMTTAVAVASR